MADGRAAVRGPAVVVGGRVETQNDDGMFHARH